MSENNEFDRTAAESDDEAAEGQYVEGDYGTAGTAGENPPEAAEGEYPTGDYGAAGVSGATAVGAEEGDYPEGDYGAAGAGTTPPAAVEGEYPEGDYGTAGDAGRQRRATRAGRLRRRGGPPGPLSGGLRAQRNQRRPARPPPEDTPEFRGSGPSGGPACHPPQSKVERTALNFELTLKRA